MISIRFSSFGMLIAALALPSVISAAEPIDSKGAEFFEKKIRPVLAQHCLECHTASQKPKGALSLDTREGVLKGGRNGASVVPGKPAESLLIEALRHESLKMPPKGKLSPAVIRDFETWIEMGAPDPRDSASAKGYKRAEAKDLWAFKKPEAPPAPKVKDAAWSQGDIDRIVLARLEEKKLKPNGEADRATLLRRVTFDLIGLPPTPAEIADFVADASPNAFEKVVDRLLKSPHFGERWGRHWLDVVHYAENTGIVKYDAPYPYAWKYRDWVISAFNDDMPYDQFVRAQIAGDLLPAKTNAERERNHIATGMLVVGRIRFGDPQSTMDSIDEQIDVVSQGFMGLTVSCARCHDHKFDPISIKDYYSLAGVFKSTAAIFPKGPGGDGGAAVAKGGAKAGKKNNAPDAAGPVPAAVMGVAEAGKMDHCRLLHRGDIANPGEVVSRGIPPSLTGGAAIEIKSNESGRRQLAEWLASRDNPLTARVFVNRLWHHLFGRGLAPSVDNFGSMSEAIALPELIDHLAVRFMDRGWSPKSAIREIVLSRTYRMSSDFSKANFEIDPENFHLWRHSQRRLDAEAIRDGILAVGGQLNPQPLKGSLVNSMNVTAKGKGKPGAGPDHSHRSVYLPIVRGRTPEILKTFDFADPSLVIGRRDVTTVPTQALYLMNNAFVIDNAGGLAKKLLSKSELDDMARIDLAYRTALGRSATSQERERAQIFLAEYAKALEAEDRTASSRLEKSWTSFCQALLGSAEFRYIR